MSSAYYPTINGAFPIASDAEADARVGFIKRTYSHLGGAVVALVGVEWAVFQIPGIDGIVQRLFGSGRAGWLLVIGAFLVVNFLAERWARSTTSVGVQYAGLGIYILAESVVLFPLLWIAARFGGKDVIPCAALLTLILFGGLTVTVFMTRKDFSFLAPALTIGGLALFGIALCGVIFGFSMGIVGAGFGLALAAGYVLYDTSNVMHHYRVDQHVAASLALFASVALMFWYVLRILLSVTSRR